MKSILISLFVFVSILFIGFQALGEEWTAEQKEIVKLEEKYWNCIKRSDIDTYKDMLHSSVSAWPSNSYNPKGKTETVTFVKGWCDYDPPVDYEIIPKEVKIFSDIAIIYYSYKYKGSKLSGSGRVTHTWKNENGVWHMIGGMSASYTELPTH